MSTVIQPKVSVWTNNAEYKKRAIEKSTSTENIRKITKSETIKSLIKVGNEFKGERIEVQNVARAYLFFSLTTLVQMKVVAKESKSEKKELEKLLENIKIREGVSENHRLVKFRFPNLNDSTRNRYVRLLDYRDEKGWAAEKFLDKCKKKGIQKLVNEYMRGKRGEKPTKKKSQLKIKKIEAKVTFAVPFKSSGDMVFVIKAVKGSGKNVRLIQGARADKILKDIDAKK